MRTYATVSNENVNYGVDFSYSMKRFIEWSLVFKDIESYLFSDKREGMKDCVIYGSVRFENTFVFDDNIIFPLGQWIYTTDGLMDEYKSFNIDMYGLYDSMFYIENDLLSFNNIPLNYFLNFIHLNTLMKIYYLYNKLEGDINDKDYYVRQAFRFFYRTEYIGDIIVYLTIK